MFVIFGWLKESHPVHDALKCYCYICQHSRRWELWRETEWVIFFGQRTLPFMAKHAVVCSNCSDSLSITNAQSRRLGVSAVTTQLESLIHQHQLSGKSETQKRFLESVRTTNANTGD